MRCLELATIVEQTKWKTSRLWRHGRRLEAWRTTRGTTTEEQHGMQANVRELFERGIVGTEEETEGMKIFWKSEK